MKLFHAFFSVVLFCALFSSPLQAQQTDNHGIHVTPVPASKPITIDGKLDDWDLSGKVVMCYDLETLRDIYSAEISMMYDAENLYVAAHWTDATPMGNSHDPRYMANRGWAGDCLQLRIKTDRITHVTAWYYAPTQSPAMHLDYGVGLNKAFGGPSKVLNKTEGWKLEEGAEMAFAKDANGKGYVQEMKIPWKLITNEKTYKAGDQFNCGYELLWGEADWPVHRYADNMADGASSREFFFTAVNSWGPAWLEAKNHLTLPEPAYVTAAREADGMGPVNISYELPKDARVTLAIDNASGKRIRNLIAARPRKAGKNTEHWDGLDDNGKPAEPGDYKFKVLYHDGIHVNYVMSYSSPGNPSWDTADGTGAFYGDHTAAFAAAAAGDYVALLCPLGEAGKHLIVTDLNGQRKWGLHNRLYADGIAVATDGKILYTASVLLKARKEGDRSGRTFIWRVDVTNGKFAPWSRKDATGAEMVDLDIVPDGAEDVCKGIALNNGKLAILLAGEKRILIVDGKSGDTVANLTGLPEGLTAIAYSNDGKIFVTSSSAIYSVDASGTTSELCKGLDSVFGLAIDAQENLYVSQRGKAQNIVVFNNAGKKLREIGKAGGRPGHGVFDENAVLNPGRLAIDSKGRLWVPEQNFNPKRTSVWSTDGKLITDFIGSNHYSGAGALNPFDATMAFSDSTVFRIDLDKGTWRPIYSVGPRNHPDEIFKPGFDSHLRIVLHGKDTLLYSGDRTGSVYCLLNKDGQWRMASAVGFVQKSNHHETQLDSLHPLMAPHVGEMFAWADLNADGLVQPNEITFGKVMLDGKPVADVRGCYWPSLPDADGTIAYTSGSISSLVKLSILGYTDCGAPRYDFTQAKILKLSDDTLKNPFKDLGHVMGGSNGNVYLNGSPLLSIDKDGKILGMYPSNLVSVHGSHNALSAKPGYLIGPLSILGTVNFGGEIGEVFDINGNLGENYLFTSDAMWIQTVFKDTRGLYEEPTKAVRGMPMDAITAGSECFGGNFTRTTNGKTYLTIGSTDARVLEMTGLESIKRLSGSFKYSTDQFTQAQQFVQEKAAKSHQSNRLIVRKVTTPPTIDGKHDDWSELMKDESVVAEIRESLSQRFGRANMKYDDQNLYVAWRVNGVNTMRNGGQDERQLFKTGDCVDIMFGPEKSPKGEGNLRLLISKLGKDTIAELYQKVVPGTPEKDRVGFSSPWRTIYFDRVTRAAEVKAVTNTGPGGYFVEAAIPWKVLGIEPKSGLKLRGDIGILFSDSGGTTTVSRKYWSNKATGLVSDVPGEADLTPTMWGDLELE